MTQASNEKIENQAATEEQKQYPPCPLCGEPFCYSCKKHYYRCACPDIGIPLKSFTVHEN